MPPPAASTTINAQPTGPTTRDVTATRKNTATSDIYHRRRRLSAARARIRSSSSSCPADPSRRPNTQPPIVYPTDQSPLPSTQLRLAHLSRCRLRLAHR
ncbi:hypothetical protein Dimus_028235 [Dionaea muscipula]